MKLFKNREVKNIVMACFLTFFICFLIFSFLIRFELKKINNLYAKENIALVGAITDVNPELESNIVPIIVKGEFKEYYTKGKQIMDKYSYTENLSISKNYLFEESLNHFNLTWILAWVVFFMVTVLVVIKCISPIYKNLCNLSRIADEMVEGKFNGINKLKLSEGDLFIFYNKFNDMGERLEKAVDSLKKEKINLKNIINDISHQLKTPLATLITYNDILQNPKTTDKEVIKKFLYLSSQQLDRMEWLVVTLLKYARLESNVVEYHKEVCSLKTTVEESIAPLKILAKEKNQKITFNSQVEGFYLHDRRWLGEAFSNIIKNAIEHTDNGGIIGILLEETPLSITISIKDNGKGISSNDLKNIFKRFYKGENTLNPKSIGIGLSLSKVIIDAHYGDIAVKSEVGQGTTFYITFLKTII